MQLNIIYADAGTKSRLGKAESSDAILLGHVTRGAIGGPEVVLTITPRAATSDAVGAARGLRPLPDAAALIEGAPWACAACEGPYGREVERCGGVGIVAHCVSVVEVAEVRRIR